MNTFLKINTPKTYDTNTANAFDPIGIGKPLIVRLHTVYVGELKKRILGSKQSILVTSAIKDDITYQAAPKAVHQIYNNIDKRELLYPKAINEGTELIYFMKAFDGGKLNITLEIKADRFKQKTLEDISNTMGLAAGLPIFSPYAPYLLAGSQLLKISGNSLNRALEKVPVLTYDFSVLDDVGGLDDTPAGYLIGISKDAEKVFENAKVVKDKNSPGNVYLAVNNKKYQGDQHYIIVSLDGNKTERYHGFKSTLASASLLKKYYGLDKTTNINDVKQMLDLFNDYSFLKKAKKIQKQIDKSTDKKEKDNFTKLLNAYKGNISNEDLLNALNAITPAIST